MAKVWSLLRHRELTSVHDAVMIGEDGELMHAIQTDPQVRLCDPDVLAILENIRVLDEPMGQLWRRQKLAARSLRSNEATYPDFVWGTKALPDSVRA